ncbi:hypothetical protein K432DRAFT_454237, partial [Lepidopterella palustris CBS 459.81]
GCTRDFCQAGRSIHTDEARVGENRTVDVVEQECVEFLNEMRQDGHFKTDEEFEDRMNSALDEIRSSCRQAIVRGDRDEGTVGGNWMQTSKELEFGIRRAWRNARKCIMRSHCEELQLVDLRAVTTSKDMAIELIKGMTAAFDDGNIRPTVFVFPPRAIDERGPMIWNSQVLSFAGYEIEDDSILGDPMNAQLTKDIIELGWKPPETKSRWDLLPLVTMAFGDAPAVVELPPNLRQLVDIRHPRYSAEFERMDLKWVPFPALTRFGFDIGGVQYTATPFIGWFMDAEIGVRDLADSFRYNVLPEIALALGPEDIKSVSLENFGDLPEYEKLALLSRAQAELNYAVHWSFQQSRVTLIDSLTASIKYCQYDDEFKKKNGFRLPADPYWLSPPQGSIIPLWHRGGAPNYQPKPMISRHVENPVNAWKREQERYRSEGKIPPAGGSPATSSSVNIGEQEYAMSISIHYCSAGTVAQKLANKLHKKVKTILEVGSHVALVPEVAELETLQAVDLTGRKILLLIVSSTGQGEIPANGLRFADVCKDFKTNSPSPTGNGPRFAILGNGDSRYASTFNGAASKISDLLIEAGGRPLTDGPFPCDNATESPPLSAFDSWWETLEPTLQGIMNGSYDSSPPSASAFTYSIGTEPEQAAEIIAAREQELLNRPNRSLCLHIDIGCEVYEDMSCIQILPLNPDLKVRRVIEILGVDGFKPIDFGHTEKSTSLTFARYISEVIDLEARFNSITWMDQIRYNRAKSLSGNGLRKKSVVQVLEHLHGLGLLPDSTSTSLVGQICLAMPLLRPVTYSVASSIAYISLNTGKCDSNKNNHVDTIIKTLPGGRFSEIFLTESPCPTLLKLRFVDSRCGPQLREWNGAVPLIIVSTGAGFGPVRCLLQRQLYKAAATTITTTTTTTTITTRPTETETEPETPLHPPIHHPISLFLGLHPSDINLTHDILNHAAARGIVDILSIVSSNSEQYRIQDKFGEDGMGEKLRHKVGELGGVIFVCGSARAAWDITRAWDELLEGNSKQMLRERYVEECF